MNEAIGNAANVTEQAVKAMEAAYDVICLEQPMTIEDLIYGAAAIVEFTDSDGCNEYKAGFRIFFYDFLKA